MPLIETKGAASAQGFGEFAQSSVANYIEDCFSCFLYTGNGSTQTITNGIDLLGKGGLVWIKSRSSGASYYDHVFCDTARGTTKYLASSGLLATSGEQTGAGAPYDITSFNSNGFSLGPDNTFYKNTGTSTTYASWTFRKQPKFFDVVTFTANTSTTNQRISHSLGSVPGCIIIKSTNDTLSWYVYHRSLGRSKIIYLDQTAGQATATNWLGTSDPTATDFGFNAQDYANTNGTFVAYLFAHDAGGFGLTGTDNVISCGSFTKGASTNTITLGYEPQWLLIKNASQSEQWRLYDVMRGMPATSASAAELNPNSSAAEVTGVDGPQPLSTGFTYSNGFSGDTYIYIAIRRGPMKVPTDATKVFVPLALNNALNTVNTTGFPIDLQWYGNRAGNANNIVTVDRLRGVSTNTTQQQNYLRTASTAAEVTSGGSSVTKNWGSTGFWTASAQDGASAAYWNFQRAPSFFDEVCYTGTGTTRTVNHNLTVPPELIIIKDRTDALDWTVYSATTGNAQEMVLNSDTGAYASTKWGSTSPTSSVFTLATTAYETNGIGSNYVAYLFATCAGVSKVSSYTGTGATQTISCGFTGGARWVLIKRTDSTGDWYVWDTARGMVSGTDPSLKLNTTAAEVNANSIYTTTGGFQIVSTAAGINASGGTYIFLAVA